MEWLKRLGAAIDYIEENLDREISYDEVARIACCSTYIFNGFFLMYQECHYQSTYAAVK